MIMALTFQQTSVYSKNYYFQWLFRKTNSHNEEEIKQKRKVFVCLNNQKLSSPSPQKEQQESSKQFSSEEEIVPMFVGHRSSQGRLD
jgi:hypothetical protein